VGAVSVHGFAGLWGVLAVGLFAAKDGVAQAYVASDSYGLLLGGGAEQLGIQAIGAGAIIGWTVATSGLMFLVLKYTVGLRASEEEELRGLDIFEHGVEAYPDFTPAAGRGVFGAMAESEAAQTVSSAAVRPHAAPGSAGGGGGGGR
jgi:Amt family ammonium transporter